jgi:hypothetical protein
VSEQDEHAAAPQQSPLEDVWRKRLAAAEQTYHSAADALEEAKRQGHPDTGRDVAAAAERKAGARSAYLSALRKFADLVLRGKSPSDDK